MNPITASYKQLRVFIGSLAFLLVVGCTLGGFAFGKIDIQASISAYYHTNMRDFLEGTLMGVGVFLLTYYGYSKLDRAVNTTAGISGICIALFPCYGNDLPAGIFQLNPHTSNIFHGLSASIFFLLLAYNSYFLFTKTDPTQTMTPMKVARNVIYRTCGIIMVVSMIAFVLCYLILGADFMDKHSIILIIETVMLFAFGISWITKGEAIFGDKLV